MPILDFVRAFVVPTRVQPASPSAVPIRTVSASGVRATQVQPDKPTNRTKSATGTASGCKIQRPDDVILTPIGFVRRERRQALSGSGRLNTLVEDSGDHEFGNLLAVITQYFVQDLEIVAAWCRQVHSELRRRARKLRARVFDDRTHAAAFDGHEVAGDTPSPVCNSASISFPLRPSTSFETIDSSSTTFFSRSIAPTKRSENSKIKPRI